MDSIVSLSTFLFSLLLLLPILLSPTSTFASETKLQGLNVNAIDKCWRLNPDWRRHRQQLATCSVGFSGKMTNNIGKNLKLYRVTDPSDNPLNPKKGTLRYGATMIKGKVWITFQRNMVIKLERPLLISSFTAIDGRGVSVHITGNACLTVYKETNIIIHGLVIHHCKSQAATQVMGTNGKIVGTGNVDGDAIRLVSASKVWIDHNTLYQCEDGLLDVTRGSTDITISNNWFRDQDKVMLLGHDDGFVRDRDMRVTLVFNHFGPNCNQRMPRIRHGYAHVANNLYQGWTQYAIGGSMNPRVKSEANLFIAPKSGSKELIWTTGGLGGKSSWKFFSVGDVLENGATFSEAGTQLSLRTTAAKPGYNAQQWFKVADAKFLRQLTSSSGALKCSRNSRC